ncbi:MAG: hypothetical protein P8X96_25070 [Desulfobacteraceae bacterium]
MKKLIITLLVLVVFGCQGEKALETELIISNVGKTDFINLWFSIDNEKLMIDRLRPGEQRSFHIDAVGDKRIDYGFEGDEGLRRRMGGELFFYGRQDSKASGTLEIGLKDGLIHKMVGKPRK